MSGRGGGRGGGRGRGSFDPGFGIERQGPILQAPATYPPNPNLIAAEQLTEDDRKLVTFNRMFINYWKHSEFHIIDNPPPPEIETYSLRLFVDTSDPNAQMGLITSYVSPDYFPPELLQTRFVRPYVRGSKDIGNEKRRQARLQEIEQKEKEGQGNASAQNQEDGKPAGEEDLFAADEIDDFGGDDYAHDHYGDEDMDDHMDGDGDDDGTF